MGRLLVYIESIVSNAVGNQPSWAHVVKGGVSVVPLPPPPPVQAKPQLFRNPYKATSDILIAAKAALKAVTVEPAPAEVVVSDEGDIAGEDEHSYALAIPPSPAMEVSVDSAANESMEGNISCGPTQSSKPKKAKLSDDSAIDDNVLGKSPDLQHKIPARPRTDQEDSQESENSDDRGQKTNMFGVKYVMWFEVGIEGKEPMDQEEEDWGGKLEFRFSEIEDYFFYT